MRQISPLAARFIEIKNRIPHPPQFNFQRAAHAYFFFQTKAFFYNCPFFIRQITGVSFIRHHFLYKYSVN